MTALVRSILARVRFRALFRRVHQWRAARQSRGFAFAAIMRLRRSVSPERWAEFLAWRDERDARWRATR